MNNSNTIIGKVKLIKLPDDHESSYVRYHKHNPFKKPFEIGCTYTAIKHPMYSIEDYIYLQELNWLVEPSCIELVNKLEAIYLKKKELDDRHKEFLKQKGKSNVKVKDTTLQTGITVSSTIVWSPEYTTS